MEEMNVSVVLKFDAICIYFGSTLHLYIKRSKLLGIQSWQYGEKNYSIEYILENGAILTEYNDFEKFQKILNQLNSLI